MDTSETAFTPRPVRDTGEPLDLAIAGAGYFGVQTARGVRYTRHGRFTCSPQGLLVTASGDLVLGSAGRAVRVAPDGRVDGRALEVVLLDNPREEGDGLVWGTPAGTAGAGHAIAGMLEASGSEAARSMADMLASLRAFSHDVRGPMRSSTA